MTAQHPGRGPRPFSAAELGGLPLSPDDLAGLTSAARDVEATAARGTARPGPHFTDRVMAAVEAEPAPAPVLAAEAAVRRLSAGALLGSLRDAVRVAFGHGFPAVARAQAIALVAAATLSATAVAAGTAGALGLFDGRLGGPTPVVVSSPGASGLPTPVPGDTAVPGAVTSAGPDDGSSDASEAPGASEAAEPSGPGSSREPSDGTTASGGTETRQPGGGEASGGDGGARSGSSPSATPRPEQSSGPAQTTGPSDGGEEQAGASPTPSPSASPEPTRSPEP